jgi:ATP-dependent exoDNAse (exonuclease V) beta subunit
MPPDRNLERSIGVVVHSALEELARRAALPETSEQNDHRRWRRALQREGLQGRALEAAVQHIVVSVNKTLSRDSCGRWLLSNEHREAHSEWQLTAADPQGCLRDLVIDRSFIDAATGIRWIIDYKTSQPDDGEDMTEFFVRESENYIDQMRGYRNAVRNLGENPVRCALFFTAIGQLHVITELD